jgi:hypothetical protein
MKRAENKSKVRWARRGGLLLTLTAVIAAVVVGGSFAAYTSVNMVKRVVSTMAGSGLLFSSNYMGAYESSTETYTIRTFSFNEEVDVPSFAVSVCNYAQSNPKYINEKDITYTFTATLVDRNGAAYDVSKLDLSQYTLAGKVFQSGSMTLTGQSLSGGTKTKNVYTITVDKNHLSDVYVMVTAVPDSSSLTATENKKLARILRATLTAAQKSAGWSGSFTDAMINGTPSALDGFNYEISGYGEGTVTLSWDDSKVTVSPWFVEDMAAYIQSSTANSITFTVSADADTTYRLQFYRVQAASGDETPAEAAAYVTCSFEAASTAEGGTDNP